MQDFHVRPLEREGLRDFSDGIWNIDIVIVVASIKIAPNA